MTRAEAEAHQRLHGFLPPRIAQDCADALIAVSGRSPQKDATTAAKRARRLRRLRKPNKTEAEYGRILEARKNRGEILCYGFEEITLRWADLSYTPDWHVCEPWAYDRIDTVISDIVPIVHVFIEIKGGWKWEDSIVKWKAFAKGKAFAWARFEMWQKEAGQWHRLA